jgi:hypothetical protein
MNYQINILILQKIYLSLSLRDHGIRVDFGTVHKMGKEGLEVAFSGSPR